MNDAARLSVVILAAGKGTRMKSDRAKVLHEVFYRPMIHHVIEAGLSLGPARTVVIVGHQEEAVRQALAGYEVEVVRQKEQLGTGHAVLTVEEVVAEDDSTVMILCGDTPLVSTEALAGMLAQHKREGADLTVMTTLLDEPTGYGRIVTREGRLSAIVEEKEADAEQKKIREINAGIYLVDRRFLFLALRTVTPDNSQGEFYLTDIVEYAVKEGKRVGKYLNANPLEVLGVNSRVELEEANRELQGRRNLALMQSGVSLCNSATISVDTRAEIGRDTQLRQNVEIRGACVIGENCRLEPGVILEDCRLGDNVRIGAYSVLHGCRIDSNGDIAPLTQRRK